MQEVYWGSTLRINTYGGGKEAGRGRGDARCYDEASTKASPDPGSSEAALVLHSGPELGQGAELLCLSVTWSFDADRPRVGLCGCGQKPLSSAFCQQPTQGWGNEPVSPVGPMGGAL